MTLKATLTNLLLILAIALSGCSLPSVRDRGNSTSGPAVQNGTSCTTFPSFANFGEGIPKGDGNPSVIALHEAAHAWISLKNGGSIGSVYKDDNMGYCAGCDVSDATAKAMVYMAGFAAEREFSGFILGPRGTDYANAKTLISAPESLLPQITADLRANRPGIFALAHELDRTQTVSGPKAAALLRGGAQSNRLPAPGSKEPSVQSSRNQTAPPTATGGRWDGTIEGCQHLGGTYDTQQRSCHYGLGNPNTPPMHDDQEDPSGWTMQCNGCGSNDSVMEAHRARGGKIGGTYARRQQ